MLCKGQFLQLAGPKKKYFAIEVTSALNFRGCEMYIFFLMEDHHLNSQFCVIFCFSRSLSQYCHLKCTFFLSWHTLRLIWTRLDSFGHIWYYLDPFGVIWTHVIKIQKPVYNDGKHTKHLKIRALDVFSKSCDEDDVHPEMQIPPPINVWLRTKEWVVSKLITWD